MLLNEFEACALACAWPLLQRALMVSVTTNFESARSTRKKRTACIAFQDHAQSSEPQAFQTPFERRTDCRGSRPGRVAATLRVSGGTDFEEGYRIGM
jgi:hypothetical protein